jgi:hypothetical protein
MEMLLCLSKDASLEQRSFSAVDYSTSQEEKKGVYVIVRFQIFKNFNFSLPLLH